MDSKKTITRAIAPNSPAEDVQKTDDETVQYSDENTHINEVGKPGKANSEEQVFTANKADTNSTGKPSNA